MRKKRVFTKKIAEELKQLGHSIVDEETNFNDVQLKVFVFHATKRFWSDFNSISKAE